MFDSLKHVILIPQSYNKHNFNTILRNNNQRFLFVCVCPVEGGVVQQQW